MTICNKDELTYYTTDNGVRYAELNGVSADTGGFDAALGSMSGERSFYLPDGTFCLVRACYCFGV